VVQTVAFIGYGRFGRALGGLLHAGGLEIRAFDPRAPLGTMPFTSLEAAVRGADVVVLATPVPTLEAALIAARPHLSPDQLVIDVGSTKVGPEDVLRRHLGADIPWAATHPLFGPVSLARGERPIEVVVCPNPLDATASPRAAEFFRLIGAEVIFETAERHDRVMASTHVLAFFLAKGLLEIGAGEGVAFAPPSFRAVARTIDAVRGDAGHLFLAIQRENPFARSERRRFIDALQSLHENIESVPDTGELDIPPLSLPPLDAPPPALQETRVLIDELDRELVSLLARRLELSRRAGAAKAEAGQAGVRDPARERALIDARRLWGEGLGLDAETIDDVWGAILLHSRKVQR
jgi:prephenate dehydrogenase